MSVEKTIRERAFELYQPPFKYSHGYIFDSNGEMVADDGGIVRVRGWGRICSMKNAEKLQDEVGKIIAEALNDFWEKHSKPKD